VLALAYGEPEVHNAWYVSLSQQRCKFANCVYFSGFFVPGFPKLKRFQDHYEAVLKKYVPGVKKHLV